MQRDFDLAESMEAFLSCLDEIALDGLDGKLIKRMSQSVGKLLTEKPAYLESLRKLSSHSIHLEIGLMTSTALTQTL